MRLYKVRGGTMEKLTNKEYTIGVGISLGNKWFTVENTFELIKWCFQYSKDKIIVYVADSIHSINLEVRNKINYEKALKKADEQGTKTLNEIKSKIEESLSKEEQDKIVYLKWEELRDINYQNKVDYLMSLYNKENHFQNKIHSIVENFTSKEEREFSKKEIHRLGEYIIEELPEIINRVVMKGIRCDAFAYPYDGELAEFAEQLQNGEIFPEIKGKIMDTESKVFLEVR